MSDIIRSSAVLVEKKNISRELRTEFVRKSLHILISLVPTLASWNFGFTVAILSAGILVYSYCELLRLKGYEIAVISKITAIASRRRDAGHFVYGPVTLGLGALLALSLYPAPAAAIAIYALAFGDGLSSLIGKTFGSIKLPFTGGKSLEGSMTCFFAVLVSAYAVSRNFKVSIALAFIATVTEAIPSKDFDNILLPFVTGLSAAILLQLL